VAADKSVQSNVCRSKEECKGQTWHHHRIRSSDAWSKSRGKGATVGLIDTGFTGHDELDGVIRPKPQRNLVDRDAPHNARDRMDSAPGLMPGHGTLVASVIASRGGISEDGEDATPPGQATGIAPEADVVAIRAIRSVIQIGQWRLPKAIRWAADNDCDVITMCLGGPFVNWGVRKALYYAVNKGVVPVCAAGNCWPWVVYPAAYASRGLSVAIGAITPDWTPWAKTPQGRITIGAPGENVWGARAEMKNGRLDFSLRPAQGTTLATSITSGVAALWFSHHGPGALRDLATQRGATVLSLFAQSVVQGAQKPPDRDWTNDERGRVGPGMLNAVAVLDYDLLSAPKTAMAQPEIPSTLDLLRDHLALDRKAAVEVDEEVAPYAAELIWLSYMDGARKRAEKSGAEALAPPPVPSDETAAVLAKRPDLAAALELT